MGRPFKQYLNAPRIYSCGSCRSHVSDHEEIISKVRLRPCSPVPESMHESAQRHSSQAALGSLDLRASCCRLFKADMAGPTCSAMRELSAQQASPCH